MSRAFDGSGSSPGSTNDKYLVAPHGPAYDNLLAFTRSAWVYATGLGGTNAGVIFVKDPNALTAPFISFEEGTSSRKLAAYIITSSNVVVQSVTTNALTLNNWYHIGFTFDANGDNMCHIYINGLEAQYDIQTT